MRLLIILVALLIIPSHCVAEDDLLAQKEQAIQDQIDRVYNALKNEPRLDPGNNLAAFNEIQALKNIVDDKGEIVKQVAIFAANPGEGQPLVANMILQMLDLSPKIVIRTLAPYLNADNAKVRSFVRDWFQAHDNAGVPGPGLPALQPVNYQDYSEYISGLVNTRLEIPPAFVDYIYEREPSYALLAFAYAIEPANTRREIELSERVVSNTLWLNENRFDLRFRTELPKAVEELAKLANHDRWWTRRYVAEMAKRHPELRTDQTTDLEDINPSGIMKSDKRENTIKQLQEMRKNIEFHRKRKEAEEREDSRLN